MCHVKQTPDVFARIEFFSFRSVHVTIVEDDIVVAMGSSGRAVGFMV